MTREITIEQLRNAIKKLPSDEPKDQPGIWYKTQKEHWLGWLKEYRGSGAYGRKGGNNQEARFAYNHIVEYHMLTWIIDAAGVEPKLVKKAKLVIDDNKTMQANAGAVRKIVPWEMVEDAIWKMA
jgi:hypothetical protein